MSEPYQLKIDAYAHIVPPRYKDMLYKVNPGEVEAKINGTPTLYDLEHLDIAINEFREMKMHPSLERALRHKDILKA